MKRFIVIALCFCIGCFFASQSSTSAETSFDFSSYSYEELIAIEEALSSEMMSRPESEPVEIKEGDYLIGEDIPEGRYTLYFIDDGDNGFTNYFVYESKKLSDYDADRYQFGTNAKDSGTVWPSRGENIELASGDYFTIGDPGVKLQRIGNISETGITEYVVPHGTTIPIGQYIVGDDIPEGKYTVYYNGTSFSRCGIYPNKKEAAYSSGGDIDAEAILTTMNTQSNITLTSGQIVKIEYGDTIMAKNEGFTFD